MRKYTKKYLMVIIMTMFAMLMSWCNNSVENKLTSPTYWLGNQHNFYTDIDEKSGIVTTYLDETVYSFDKLGNGKLYDITDKTIDGKTNHICNNVKNFTYKYENEYITIYYDEGKKEIFDVRFDYDKKFKHDVLYISDDKYLPIYDNSIKLDCSSLMSIYKDVSINPLNYNFLNFKETLKEENIKISNDNYIETDKQIVIYLFRGKGCKYCKAFMDFLNTILDEDGNFFKVVSFECWYDNENMELLKKVGISYNEKTSGAVPLIVIDDKVFEGYSSKYNNQIKETIKEAYTKKNDLNQE